MNILNRNTIVVVIATFCASGMILAAGSGMAEEQEMAVSDSSSVVTLKQTENVVKQATGIEEKKIERSIETDHFIAPPPGPFFNQGISALTSQYLKVPNDPKTPATSMKPPEQRANSLYFDLTMPKNMLGTSDLKKPIAPQLLSEEPKLLHAEPQIKIFELSKQQNAPTLKVELPVMPQNIVKQPDMKTIEHPIWMQNNTVEKDLNSVSKSQGMVGIPAMKWNDSNPMQQYIYVPVPMVPSNVAIPQLPVFNYNMITPSSYWGVPQMPNNTQFPAMQNEAIKGAGSSLQEGNK